VDLVLLSQHVLVVLDGLEAELHEGVGVQQLFSFDLVQSFLGLRRPLLVDVVEDELHGLLADAEVAGELELGHLFDL
jgi:hypothetical protein